ncbi:MAG: hypothetical protein ACUVTE_01795 [Candidatus Bathycorpusculaceae bacterium]
MLLAGGLIAVGLEWFLLTFSFTKIPEAQAVPISFYFNRLAELFKKFVEKAYMVEPCMLGVGRGDPT